tara:strand:- start:256 stop:588 length:333 start_codon:yes stop_codon:yes gene_type:complete
MATFDTSDQEFEKDVLESSSEKPVVVDWWAPWCGPCKAISPSLSELSDELEDQVKIIKCNIDDNPISPTKFGNVRGIPTLTVFKNGVKVGEKVGAVSKQHIKEFIEESIS